MDFLVNHLASPIHSAAMRILSAFIPDKIYLKPLFSSPTRLEAGILKLSKNTSVVEWFIIVRIGLIVRPLPFAFLISKRKTERPSVFFLTSFKGVVLAKSNIKSECSALLVQIF